MTTQIETTKDQEAIGYPSSGITALLGVFAILLGGLMLGTGLSIHAEFSVGWGIATLVLGGSQVLVSGMLAITEKIPKN